MRIKEILAEPSNVTKSWNGICIQIKLIQNVACTSEILDRQCASNVQTFVKD